MRTRLLAIDLDGTLLTKERVPHPANVEAIRRAHADGIKIVLASGRNSISVLDFTRQLGIGEAIICSNGGYVIGADGSELLYLGLNPETVTLALDYTEQAGVHASAYTRDRLFFLGDSHWGEIYRQRVRTMMPELVTPEEVRDMEVLKMILIDEPHRIKEHRAALEAILGDLASMTESEPEYLEILSRTASKGMALHLLSESLGIDRSETAAIGDYLNDLEMIEWAGIGAAVENAADELKAAADIVVPSNEDAGVAWFIDYLIGHNASLRRQEEGDRSQDAQCGVQPGVS